MDPKFELYALIGHRTHKLPLNAEKDPSGHRKQSLVLPLLLEPKKVKKYYLGKST